MAKHTKTITRFAVISVAMSLSSCMLGPDFKSVDMPMPSAFRGASATTESLADLPWWKVFKNRDLQNLLTETYNNNRNLLATIARVEQARHQITIDQAPMFPWINFGGNASKGKNYNSGNMYPSGNTTNSPAGGQATVSWELDIWGKTRRMTESARAEYFASEEGQRNLMLSLLKQVADSYLQLLELDEQVQITKASIASYSESLRLFNEQLLGGVGDKLQIASAEAALAASQAQLPALESQIASLENSISVLAGRAPGPVKRSGSLREIAFSVKVPTGLPAYILCRRPDIRQSEQKLRSANAQIGVAIANYFPSISLTGAGGGVSADLSKLSNNSFKSGWGVTGNLTGPIFQAGKLVATERAAREAFNAAKNDYEQTVLSALSEVSTTLIQRDKLRSITSSQERAVQAYQTAVNLSLEKYKEGLSTYIDVLYAQQNLFPAQNKLATYYYQQASTLVVLYTALGGGWNMSAKQMSAGPPNN